MYLKIPNEVTRAALPCLKNKITNRIDQTIFLIISECSSKLTLNHSDNRKYAKKKILHAIWCLHNKTPSNKFYCSFYNWQQTRKCSYHNTWIKKWSNHQAILFLENCNNTLSNGGCLCKMQMTEFTVWVLGHTQCWVVWR